MEISKFLKEKIAEVVKKVYKIDVNPGEIDISHPDKEIWGDYSTNIAMKLSSKVQQSPVEIAKKISYELIQTLPGQNLAGRTVDIFEKIEQQDPGFINFSLSDDFLVTAVLNSDKKLNSQKENLNIGQYRAKKVLFEYTDPNLFKAFHIGHFMPSAIGESLSRLYEFIGANVRKVNYESDVGLNVAKCIWGMIKTPENKEILSLYDKMSYLGSSYVAGNTAHENDPAAKNEIQELNYIIYMIAQKRLEEEEGWKPLVDYKKFLKEGHIFSYDQVKDLYYKGRQWSLESFEEMYAILGMKFDQYYFESKVGEYGLKIVNEALEKGVFKKDQGAVIFPGEQYGLHTRVFVNSFGLPTYEAKDIGLASLKAEDFGYDLSFIITGNEQDEYFKVLLKALGQIRQDLSSKTIHIGHGMLRFKEGKMGSRTGNVIMGIDFVKEVKGAILEQMEAGISADKLSAKNKQAVSEQLAVGAIKYSILKQGMGKDIIFDKNQAISITGNTGPYLQYTHARANSILEKAPEWGYDPAVILYESGEVFEKREKDVARHLAKFSDAVGLAFLHTSPNLICEYLFNLAQHYNALYNDLPILTEKNERSRNVRLQITQQVRDLLKTGLWILGIEAPDKV